VEFRGVLGFLCPIKCVFSKLSFLKNKFYRRLKMFHFQHRTLIFISGCIWLLTGCFLLPVGLKLIYDSVQKINLMTASESLPVLNFLNNWFERLELAAILLVALCVLLGFFKGRFVLSKSVNRLVRRIRSFPNPTHLLNLYSPSYYLLLASMILIGFSIKYFQLSRDIRGVVDVVIGSALICSSLFYFRAALKTDYERSFE
jgi:hypothetical protein